MKRRDLFKMAGVTATAATLSACTASTAGNALGGISSRSANDLYPKGTKKRLVVVGGGIGGMSIASNINEAHGNEVEVIVLEQNSRFHACPGSNILLTKTASEYVKESSATSTWIFDYNKETTAQQNPFQLPPLNPNFQKYLHKFSSQICVYLEF